MSIAAIVLWYFIVYAGGDWESPTRIFYVYGPYGSREECVIKMHDAWMVEGSFQKSPCFSQKVRT